MYGGRAAVFDRTKRNGLVKRLLQRAGLPLGDERAVFVVAPIAMANYPKRTEIPILRPIIDRRTICAATAAYVDRGFGTLDDLYQTIWGISREVYETRIGDLLGGPSGEREDVAALDAAAEADTSDDSRTQLDDLLKRVRSERPDWDDPHVFAETSVRILLGIKEAALREDWRYVDDMYEAMFELRRRTGVNELGELIKAVYPELG